MIRTADLLGAVKARHALTSDAGLARLLGMTEKTVARWRTGRNWPDDQTAARLAELAGLDALQVVASIHAERASTPGDRDLWRRMADRVTKAATVALCAILSLWIGGGPDAGASLALGLAAPLWITHATVYTLGTVAAAVMLGLYGPRLAGWLLCRVEAAPAV